jgi:uncharacterized protein YabN with tetrapyrrole methylase and pyrophosphatase domain
VFGEAEVADAGDVLRNWDAIKAGETGREPGIFGEVPENLPSLLYARKVQRRASSAGVERDPGDAAQALSALDDAGEDRDAAFAALGDALFAVVGVARRRHLDPELALRAAADRYRANVEGSGSS